jgi:hypothetical protein
MKTGSSAGTVAVLCAVVGIAWNGSSVAAGGQGPGPVRPEWLPDQETIVYWHWEKSRYGPALTGSESWRHFMGFLESEFRKAGAVDVERNAWRFRRWRTSFWPDDSRWSLSVDGERVAVASFGANSGSTPPEGVSAPLALFDKGIEPGALRGKIAVLQTLASPQVIAALANTDFEYRAPPAPYPWLARPQTDAWQLREGGGPESVSWQIFSQLMQTRELLGEAERAGAVGAVLVFDSGRELTVGLYTFPVPGLHEMPTLILDREAGRAVIEAARRGASATLRLQAEIVDSEAYQLVGFLPGRDYGTAADEVIQLVTHTDGPSISQDNGALGLLGLVRYFAQLPQNQRSRTLMLFLDCRHFMPGQEHAFSDQDHFHRRPAVREKIIAVIGMEHLGQIEFEEHGDRLVPSGWVDPSMMWVTDHADLQSLARQAIIDNELPSAVLRNVWRDGVHGRTQGRWYGMASPERIGGRPAVAIMGTMGAYWSASSGMERLDPELFRRQVATLVQITSALMILERDRLHPAAR